MHRDLVDEVLVETGKTELRRRLLPARVVVYFVLAMTLFFDDAYEEVMRKLVEGLRSLRSWDEDWQVPTSSALCQARARLGAEPMRELYARVARPLAGAGTLGCLAQGSAGDGHRRCPTRRPRHRRQRGRVRTRCQPRPGRPLPEGEVLGLGECGTHAVIDAHLGGVLVDERELARPLLASVEPGMLVLADRGFYSRAFWDEAAATGAQLLWRVQSSLKLHVVTELADGSYLSVLLTDIDRQRIRRHRARGPGYRPAGPHGACHRVRHRQPRQPGWIAHPADHHHPRSRAGLGQ